MHVNSSFLSDLLVFSKPESHDQTGAEQFALRLLRQETISVEDLRALWEKLPQSQSARAEEDTGFGAGAYSHGGVAGLRRPTKDFPLASACFAAWLRHVAPGAPFSSIMLLCNDAAGVRKDIHNGPFDYVVAPLTNVTGEGLVLVGYTVRSLEALSAADAAYLTRLGFRLPSPPVPALACPVPCPAKDPTAVPPPGDRAPLRSVPPACLSADLPLFLELCCGSATLSGVVQEAGFSVLPIDWGRNVRKPAVHPLQLDLRSRASWGFVKDLVKCRKTFWVHVAPPCGTASMARGIGRGPRPLRSPQHVWGLPGLTPVELGRVTSANSIYEETAAFVVWILDDAPDVLVTVENPLHSLMWMLPPFQSLLQRLHLVSFDACRHGSTRAKATGFLTNHDAFSSLSGPCPGCVQHDAWGQTPDGAWSTKLEAAYPRLLCQRLLACAAPVAAARGLQPDRDAVNPHALARAAAAVQPRGRKFPPVISEFAYTVTVRSTSEPPLNEKSAAWMNVPPHAKLLRRVVDRGLDTQLAEGGSALARSSEEISQTSGIARSSKELSQTRGGAPTTAYTFGVYRTPMQFLAEAKLITHPFDSARALPDPMLRVLFTTLTKGPLEIMKIRLAKLKLWKQWAAELQPEERALRSSMAPSVRKVLGNKRIALLRKVAESLEWPDTSVFGELTEGFRLTGYMQRTGIFTLDANRVGVLARCSDSQNHVMGEGSVAARAGLL